ncbi:ShlB/FhaC/HecB family hemolysin secretion/activation protein [Hydrogenophaga sp. RWCD_12]|uniref:ShlB/FhaC/HecB family hemolysin secretion/activation protein n=1 Tax=Hydrogenophaga sp. RWCD_12 TaxID=3391190 RepID=UPI00398491E7
MHPARHTTPPISRLVGGAVLVMACATGEAQTPPAADFAELPYRPAHLEVTGARAYAAEDLLKFSLAWLRSRGQPVTARSVAEGIEQIYREDGHALAEVAVRPDPGTASLRWEVMEGHVAQVNVIGADGPTRLRIERYLNSVLHPAPLMQSELERAVALADDLANVNVTSSLVPLQGDGHRLDATVTQNLPFTSASIDWVPMRPGYSTRLGLQHERYSVINAGDLLRLQGMVTRDRSDGHSWLARFHYRTPRGDDGDYLEIIGGNGRSDRDPGGLALSTELRGTNVTAAWGYPVQRDLHAFSYVIGALDFSRARMKVGDATPRSEATAARVYLVNGDTASDGRLLQYTVELSAGVRPSTPTGQADDGRSRFVHARAGLGTSGHWTLGRSLMSYRFESLGQWTSQSLPSVEKFSLGHYPFLRGYAPAEVAGDRGAAFTFELAHHGSHDGGTNRLSPFVFVSAGRASTVATAFAASSARTLASTGVGLRGNPVDRIGVEAWCAWPLRDGPLSEKRDPAFYLQIGTQW